MSRETNAGLVALRRDLHRHPELRFTERRTAEILATRLAALGFEVIDGVASTGVHGTLDSGRPGPHVLLRADMDALPTQDLKTVEYASSVPGVAHACGHDVHCVVVLGAAAALAASDALAEGGRLTVLFQPAEEIPFGETSGAQAVLDSGVLDGRADAVLGIHCWPQLDVGSVGLDPEVAMAAKLAFRIDVTGQGAHAATPQLGRDALLAASQMVFAFHTLAGRTIDPNDRVALNVGTLSAGTSQSIVPAAAELSGTIRSLSETVGGCLKAAVERIAAGIASANGVDAVVEWNNQMPEVRNDPALVALAQAALAGSDAVEQIVTLPDPPMTSDDFALLARQGPALYMKLGVAAPGGASWPSLHDGRFDVDERCIAVGVSALTAVARAVLRRDAGDGSPHFAPDRQESVR